MRAIEFPSGRRAIRARAGFTLMEGLVAAVVLAILVLGVCGTLSSAYQQSQDVNFYGQATMLMRQLSDEITSKPLADPTTGSTTLGPGSGMTSRSQYTHITNYSGYSDESTAMPLLEGGSSDVSGGTSYSRQVTVTVGAKPSIDTASPSTDFGLVTVTVTGPNGQSVSLTKFVAKYPISR